MIGCAKKPGICISACLARGIDMNADVFAAWLSNQGYEVVRTASSYWYEVSPRVYQAFPYHWTIEPHDDELQCLLREHQALALRYSTPLGAACGKVSYHVICEGTYEMASAPRRARQSVRRGLAYADVEQISISRLATDGWRLRQETLERQGRADAESQEWWCRLCQCAEDLPGFEAWGALHEGDLVASFLAFVCDGCYVLPYQQSATSHLQYRVNNAIFFAVARQALRRPEISKVFFCLESLDAPCSMDEFKFRMGFTAFPVRQRVVFHPWLDPLLGNASHAVVKRLVRWFPNSLVLAKGEGMLRFYLEGRCPPTEQTWPEGLVARRSELLASLHYPAGL